MQLYLPKIVDAAAVAAAVGDGNRAVEVMQWQKGEKGGAREALALALKARERWWGCMSVPPRPMMAGGVAIKATRGGGFQSVETTAAGA